MRHCRHASHQVPDLPRDTAHVIVPECAPHTEWLAQRGHGIGGSEIGALIGASEHATAFDVYRAKVEGGKDISHLPAVEWGHRLEEAVAAKTADELGVVSRPGGGLWAHTEHDFARVTPDRIATRRRKRHAIGVLECKTAGDNEGWRDGSAPLAYQAQVQWQLGILGLEVGWLGCLVLNPARDFHVVEVRFDPEWFAEMFGIAEQFWHRNVLGEKPPMHDFSHPRTEGLLKEAYPRSILPAVELDDDAESWLEDYTERLAEFEKAKTRLDEVKNYFRDQMGDAEAGYIGDHKVVTYPNVEQRRVDVDKLRAEYPDVAARCTKTETHRRLSIKLPK